MVRGREGGAGWLGGNSASSKLSKLAMGGRLNPSGHGRGDDDVDDDVDDAGDVGGAAIGRE